MKKLLALTLSILLVFCVIPFGVGATSVQLVTSSSNVYDVLSAALATDKGKAAGSLTGLSGSNWSIGYLDNSGNYIDYYQSATAGDFKFQYRYNYQDVSFAGVDAYLISWMSILPYDLSEETVTMIPRYNWNDSVKYPTSITEKGIVLTGKAALRFTAPQDGHIRISDPSGGKISAIASVNGTNTTCLDNNDKTAKFSFKQNGETIWPVDSDYYQFNLRGKANVDFPVIDAEVKEGDVITFAFEDAGSSTNVFAMNPQIDYIEEQYDTMFDAFDASIRSGTASGLSETNWSMGYATDSSMNFTEDLPSYAANLPISDADGWNNRQLTGYPGYDYWTRSWSVTTYETGGELGLTALSGASCPSQGVLFSLAQGRPTIGFTYTAPRAGRITLQGNGAAGIGTINYDETDYFLNSLIGVTASFAIYKNSKKIWPLDSDGIEFDSTTPYFSFPEINSIKVREGDKINFVFQRTSGIHCIVMAFNAAVKYERKIPVFDGHSLVLGSQIGVNFFVDTDALTEAQKRNSYMSFSITNREGTIEIPYDKTALNESGEFNRFTCYVSSIQMAETITPTFHYGVNKTIVGDTYSVAEYITWAISNGNEELVTLVKALKDYGHYMQAYFSEKDGGLTYTALAKCEDSADYSASDFSTLLSDLSSFDMIKTIDGTAVTGVSCSLDLDGPMTVNAEFATTDSLTATTFATVPPQAGSEIISFALTAGDYTACIQGIPISRLGIPFTVAGNGTTNSTAFTTEFSGLSCLREVLNDGGSTTTEKSAMTALYGYYDKALAYQILHP